MLQSADKKIFMEQVKGNPINGHIGWREYAGMFYFLSLCGNVFFQTYATSYIYVLTAFVYVALFYQKKVVHSGVSIRSKESIKLMIIAFLVLFILQFFVFGWNTVPGIINHISKFIIGAGYIAYKGSRFRMLFFRTMYLICIVALPLWILQQVAGGIPGLSWSLGKTIWIYCYREGEDIVRNCGFFWEPGAMGGYIALLFLLFFNDLAELYRTNKLKCLIIFATLLSTQSTGAYMSFGVIMIAYLAVSMRSRWKYVLLPLCVWGALAAYNKMEFLSDKVESQNEDAAELSWGEYSSTRMGTLMFDLYYVVKHPLIGNGLHERTRLADHPQLAIMLKNGDEQGAGNGFSDTIAKWGIIFCFVYGWVFFRSNKELNVKRKMCFLFLICVILQGEGFMNYPLFLGLPCLRIINDKKIALIYNKR